MTNSAVSSSLQDPLTEHAAYEQMALFASACAFSWSKWNARCGAENLIMQVFSVYFIELSNLFLSHGGMVKFISLVENC